MKSQAGDRKLRMTVMPKEPSKIVVCGSRTWANEDRIRDRLRVFEDHLPPPVVISGGAQGADRMAALIARELGYVVVVMRARWMVDSRYNPQAGFERNERMLAERPALVIAFWDGASRGTAHTLRRAQELNIPVEIVKPTGPVERIGWGQKTLFD